MRNDRGGDRWRVGIGRRRTASCGRGLLPLADADVQLRLRSGSGIARRFRKRTEAALRFRARGLVAPRGRVLGIVQRIGPSCFRGWCRSRRWRGGGFYDFCIRANVIFGSGSTALNEGANVWFDTSRAQNRRSGIGHPGRLETARVRRKLG